jgi:drug/metabolite transporter (DMT)-like permease
MAVPFLMYPLAEGWGRVSTAVAGMINGGLPLVSAVVAALIARSRPSRRRIIALTVGFAGMASIAAPSLGDDSSATLAGIALLLIALLGYALGANLARPFQAKYSSPQLMLRIALAGTVWTSPLGLWGATRSSFGVSSMAAMVVLGAVGTGIAFWVYGVLLHRAGPVRGMIAIFFTPIVGTLLGVLVRDERVHPLAYGGMALVIVGAILTSRPDIVTENTR